MLFALILSHPGSLTKQLSWSIPLESVPAEGSEGLWYIILQLDEFTWHLERQSVPAPYEEILDDANAQEIDIVNGSALSEIEDLADMLIILSPTTTF